MQPRRTSVTPLPMAVRRVVYGALGIGLWVVALALLRTTGLPERADYSGVRIAGESFAPEVNRLAPPFSAVSWDDAPIDLLGLRGQPVILNFWATWCEPCRIELPELIAVANQRPDVQVVGVNLGETADTARAWLFATGINIGSEALLFAFDHDGAIANAYALRGQPSTYIIDSAGYIRHIFYGMTTSDAILGALATVI